MGGKTEPQDNSLSLYGRCDLVYNHISSYETRWVAPLSTLPRTRRQRPWDSFPRPRDTVGHVPRVASHVGSPNTPADASPETTHTGIVVL